MVNSKTFPHLTGLRGVAAYLVLFAHSVDSAFQYAGVSFYHEYVAFFAYLGMTLFFVLSGFVIAYGYTVRFNRDRWGALYSFGVSRFARLFPLYFVVLMLEGGWYLKKYGCDNAIWLSHLTLTQSWWNAQSIIFSPAWSISTECFFYFVFAVVMCTCPSARRQVSGRGIKLVALGFYVSFLAFLILLFSERIEITELLRNVFRRGGNPQIWSWIQYFSPVVRIGEFVAGYFAARLLRIDEVADTDFANARKSHWLCVACGASIVAFGGYNALHFGYDTFLFFISVNFACAPSISYLLFATCRYSNAITKMCSQKFLIAAGEISYSVYLLQFLVFGFLQKHLHRATWSEPSFGEWLLLASNVVIFMVVTTAIAHYSYRFIEQPSRRLIRRLLRQGPSRAVAG